MIVATRCPVLDLTEEHRAYLDLFAQCYQVHQDGITGHIHFERIALADAGGLADQDAKTLWAFALLERVTLAMAHEQRRRSRGAPVAGTHHG